MAEIQTGQRVMYLNAGSLMTNAPMMRNAEERADCTAFACIDVEQALWFNALQAPSQSVSVF